MKKKLSITLLTFIASLLIPVYSNAQQTFSINLLTKDTCNDLFEIYDTTADIDDMAFMKAFLPDKDKASGKAILMCPGGGYNHVAYKHEGLAWAEYFTNQGIALFVLKYRLPKGNYDLPISDALTALETIKTNAVLWNISPDNIGIMGFSAGGHLASTIVTHAKAELRPNFQILFYPVITMDEAFTHLGSRTKLIGENANKELEIRFSNEKQLSENSPTAFIVLSADDKAVPPANSLRYFEKLIEYDIPASLHIYPIGGHGWGFNDYFVYHEQMLEELKFWLSLL